MLKKFNQYFKDLIFDRTEEIGQKILFNNKRYRELNSQIIEVQQALMENPSTITIFDIQIRRSRI